jgi:hypothetical protein
MCLNVGQVSDGLCMALTICAEKGEPATEKRFPLVRENPLPLDKEVGFEVCVVASHLKK